ncbi:MAG: hypothetical protein PF486_10940 [Prolixibacteraceae bacterium]|nr:hypothetical protein [Prolixibacteraceae bacterium]
MKRTINSAHFKKTVSYALIGAIAGYALFYFSEGMQAHILWNDEAMKSMFIGMGFGIFITNSPCARGKC